MLGLPKGSLEESTLSLFAKAGWKISVNSRSYRPTIDDPELDGRFVRAQEVSRYVEHGFFDCGLTGLDWIQENGSDVVEVCDLIYSRASAAKSRWVLCVPEDSPVRDAKDLAGKRIATELVQTVKRYFAAKNIPVEIEFSWGATEVKVPDLVDAIYRVHDGDVVFSPRLAGFVLDAFAATPSADDLKPSFDPELEQLTNREREVLRLIAQGYTYKEIARELFISVKTVEKHRSNLMKKLDLHNASMLTAYAIEKGLLAS